MGFFVKGTSGEKDTTLKRCSFSGSCGEWQCVLSPHNTCFELFFFFSHTFLADDRHNEIASFQWFVSLLSRLLFKVQRDKVAGSFGADYSLQVGVLEYSFQFDLGIKLFPFICDQVHIFVTGFDPRKSPQRPRANRVSMQHRSQSDMDDSIAIPIGREKQMQDTFDMDQLWNAMQFPEGDPSRFNEYMIPAPGKESQVCMAWSGCFPWTILAHFIQYITGIRTVKPIGSFRKTVEWTSKMGRDFYLRIHHKQRRYHWNVSLYFLSWRGLTFFRVLILCAECCAAGAVVFAGQKRLARTSRDVVKNTAMTERCSYCTKKTSKRPITWSDSRNDNIISSLHGIRCCNRLR